MCTDMDTYTYNIFTYTRDACYIIGHGGGLCMYTLSLSFDHKLDYDKLLHVHGRFEAVAHVRSVQLEVVFVDVLKRKHPPVTTR
jgi:hypothetical protein